jgi:autoinducer 2-degrading protein
MSKIALVVTAEFEPELKEEILRALLAHRERCLRDEPGTLQFEVLVPFNEPGKLMLFELYADAAAFAAHSEGASIAQYRAQTRPKMTKVTSHKCHFGNELPG